MTINELHIAGCRPSGANQVKRARRSLLLFLLLAVLSQISPAQETHLSHRARKLKERWAELQAKPTDPSTQQRYLIVFPHDYKSFLELFEFNRELYDGHKYIDVLPGLATSHGKEVGKLLVVQMGCASLLS